MSRNPSYGEEDALAYLRSGDHGRHLYNVREDWLVGWFVDLGPSEQWEFLWRLNDEELDESTLAFLGVALLDMKVTDEYPSPKCEEHLRRGLVGANFREMASTIMVGPPVAEWLAGLIAEYGGEPLAR